MIRNVTKQMPDELQEKLYWAGAYADEDTGDQIYCNAIWMNEDDPLGHESTHDECAEADAAFEDFFPDVARTNHTGYCPDDVWNEPRWHDGAERIAPGSGRRIS